MTIGGVLGRRQGEALRRKLEHQARDLHLVLDSLIRDWVAKSFFYQSTMRVWRKSR